MEIKNEELKCYFNILPITVADMVIETYLWWSNGMEVVEAKAILTTIFKDQNPIIIIGRSISGLYTRVDNSEGGAYRISTAIMERIELIKT